MAPAAGPAAGASAAVDVRKLGPEVLRKNTVPEDKAAGARRKIRRIVEQILGDCSTFSDDDDIMTFGFDSLATVDFASRLSKAFPESQLSPSLLFDYPNIRLMAETLVRDLQPPEVVPVELRLAKSRWDYAFPSQRVTYCVARDALPPTGEIYQRRGLYEGHKHPRYRRMTDNMDCVLLPGANAWVGDGLKGRAAMPNEKPCHKVELSSFLIDVEPVCMGAYARFLNIINPDTEELRDWVTLREGDVRQAHVPLEQHPPGGAWRVKEGVNEQWPMIMVSWYGANAYSLWANGKDWRDYRSAETSFLPTEAQWEYAARGVDPANFPWGNLPASADDLVFCPDEVSLDPEMTLPNFPLAEVTAILGVSPFGVRGMAGNVWQWCRDAYDADFYGKPEAKLPEAWNRGANPEKGPRSERGGSWVGPAYLARSSYRRGRAPGAKGRCLGFRCIGRLPPPSEASTDAGSAPSEAS